MKYLFIAALTAGYSASAMAQSGTEADVQAVKNIISQKPADLDKQMKPFYKANKKNAANLVAFGRAFYEAKDTANAKTYANHALVAAKNQYAPAFILLGDIEAYGDNGGQAASQYEQAIYAAPSEPEAYYKYANVYRKISPRGAVSKLEELRSQRPDLPVDALIGRIYYMSNDFDAALRAYNKADKTKMEDRDLSDYAMTAFFKQKYDTALDVAKFGLSKNPRHAAFNRLAFFNSTELKKWDDALMYADALFNKSDSAKFSYYDYTYYGNALSGAKQHEKAIEMYQKALQQEDMDNKAKRAGVIKQLSDAYKAQEDFPNAIKNYEEYLNTVEKALSLSSTCSTPTRRLLLRSRQSASSWPTRPIRTWRTSLRMLQNTLPSCVPVSMVTWILTRRRVLLSLTTRSSTSSLVARRTRMLLTRLV